MENQKPSPKSDEIDLGQLFVKLGDFLKDVGMGFLRFLAMVRRVPLENRISFTLIIVASTVIGLSYNSFLKKDYFESTMILSSDYLNKRLVENTMEKLNLLAHEQNKHGLATALHIEDSIAQNLVEFSAKPFVSELDLIELEVLKEQLKNAQANLKNERVIDQVVSRIEIENRHAFEITIRTLKPSIISTIQNSLVGYFRNNEYIKNRIENNRRNLEEKKEVLTHDLQRLDSLKSAINANYEAMAVQGRQGSNNVILSDKPVTSPVEVYTQALELGEQLKNVKSNLYLRPDFEIVDGFTAFSEPASIGNLKTILLSVLMGIIIAYVDVMLRSFNRYLSKLE